MNNLFLISLTTREKHLGIFQMEGLNIQDHLKKLLTKKQNNILIDVEPKSIKEREFEKDGVLYSPKELKKINFKHKKRFFHYPKK